MSARGFLKDLTLHQQKVRFRNTGGSRGESKERGKAFFPTIRVRLVGTEISHPSWLVQLCLRGARSCKSTEESPRMRMLAATPQEV